MIPKIIHYCWFGRGEMPELAKRCMASWKKYCPDYEMIEWNEDNFDFDQHPYLRDCLERQKYAFLSDFARLLVVQEYGGIYFDTDVELLRRPDELLRFQAFYGFENPQNVNTGQGFGAEPGHITVTAMAEEYLKLSADEEGHYPVAACPQLNTRALLPLGLRPDGTRQNVAGAEILPVEYLNPYDNATGKLRKTAHTYSVHWYAKSWMDRRTILRSKMTRPFHRVFGNDCFQWLKR